MASAIRISTGAAASTALRHSIRATLERLRPMASNNPKIFLNGMYFAYFHASNIYLSNALPNVQIPARTHEFSGTEGEDEDLRSQGQNTPKQEETLQTVSKRNKIKILLKETRNALEFSGAEGEDKDLRSQGQNTPKREETLQNVSKGNKIKQLLKETRNEICKIIENDEKRMEETLTLLAPRLTPELVTMVLSNLNSLDSALRFFQWAKAQPGIKPNSAMYDALVNIAGRCKDFETLKMLLTERIPERCFNSAKTFSFATVSHNDSELLWEVTETINKLEKFAQKSAYDMLVAALCNEDYVDCAISILKKMYTSGCALTTSTFRPLLDAHARYCQMAEVHEVFKFMKKMGCPPDATCYNLVLRKLYQNEQFAEAEKFLGMMVNTYGCKPDHVTYDILILEACKARKLQDAVRHFGRMKEDGIKPMHCTYTNLINGFLQQDGFEKAYAFVRQESGKDCPLDPNNYSFLISSCTKSGNYREVHDVLMEMKAKNLKTDHQLCNEVLEKVSRSRKSI